MRTDGGGASSTTSQQVGGSSEVLADREVSDNLCGQFIGSEDTGCCDGDMGERKRTNTKVSRTRHTGRIWWDMSLLRAASGYAPTRQKVWRRDLFLSSALSCLFRPWPSPLPTTLHASSKAED